jgi:hypothetical protein
MSFSVCMSILKNSRYSERVRCLISRSDSEAFARTREGAGYTCNSSHQVRPSEVRWRVLNDVQLFNQESGAYTAAIMHTNWVTTAQSAQLDEPLRAGVNSRRIPRRIR